MTTSPQPVPSSACVYCARWMPERTRLRGGPGDQDTSRWLVVCSATRNAWRQAAALCRTNLEGEKPAELPVVRPTKFELTINLKRPGRLASPCRSHCSPGLNEVIETT